MSTEIGRYTTLRSVTLAFRRLTDAELTEKAQTTVDISPKAAAKEPPKEENVSQNDPDVARNGFGPIHIVAVLAMSVLLLAVPVLGKLDELRRERESKNANSEIVPAKPEYVN